ncbi:MAG: hypothetical protein ACLUI3_17465 [Christensenellales bacterium]
MPSLEEALEKLANSATRCLFSRHLLCGNEYDKIRASYALCGAIPAWRHR